MSTVRLALALSAYVLVFGPLGDVVEGPTVLRVEAMRASTAGLSGPGLSGPGLPGLPPYPGAACIEYAVDVADGLATIEAQYTVAAELDAVREFYRQVFQTQGWSEVDARFWRDRWTFLVVSGQREARIRLKDRGEVVEIAIGVSEPVASTARSGPTMLAGPRSASTRPRPGRNDSRHPESS